MPRPVHHADEIADAPVRLDRMSQWLIGINAIVIPAPFAFANQNVGIDKIGNDLLHRALGYADLPRHFAQCDIRISSETQ
jgi:hypothetical protein